jgi:tagatose 1,6-diphosphate aldolase GatY/KbaY
MFDGSHLSLEENVAVTKSVVAMAAPNGVPVEAELGMVGGKEDNVDGGDGNYTAPEEAEDYVKQTGISSLAVAIGTAHGVYAGKPKLDIGRLREIRKRVSVPLVLHGASGLTESDVAECISQGICKVNFATELRAAFSEGVKAYLIENPGAVDPKKYLAAGRENVKKLCVGRIEACGSAGRASS